MKVFEGQLSKFTNVVRGWQYRWFVLKPETGHLEYYLLEENSHGHPVVGKQRAAQFLVGTMVVPSDEDSQAFSVVFATGDTYKLRASNTRERQVWVDRIRHVGQLYDNALAHNHHHQTTFVKPGTPPIGAKSHLSFNGQPSDALQTLSLSVLDAFGSVHDILQQTDTKHQILAASIETLPLRAANDMTPTCLDEDLLIIKATSQAALQSLESALSVLQDLQEVVRPTSLPTPKPKLSLVSPIPMSPRRSMNTSLVLGGGASSGSGIASLRFGGSSQSVNIGESYSSKMAPDTISIKSVQVPSKKSSMTMMLPPSSVLSTSSPSVNLDCSGKEESKKQKQRATSTTEKEKTGQGS